MELAILFALCAGATWAIGMTAAKPALERIDVLSYMLVRWMLVIPLVLLYGAVTDTLILHGWGAVGWAVLAGITDAVLGGLLYLFWRCGGFPPPSAPLWPAQHRCGA